MQAPTGRASFLGTPALHTHKASDTRGHTSVPSDAHDPRKMLRCGDSPPPISANKPHQSTKAGKITMAFTFKLRSSPFFTSAQIWGRPTSSSWATCFIVMKRGPTYVVPPYPNPLHNAEEGAAVPDPYKLWAMYEERAGVCWGPSSHASSATITSGSPRSAAPVEHHKALDAHTFALGVPLTQCGPGKVA